MESLRQQQLTISQQLARLSLGRILSSDLVRSLSTLREEMVTDISRGESTATPELRAVALAWVLATMAQSCASLATELQVSAERLSVLRVTCPDSIYNALYDSTETGRLLIDSMRQSFAVINEVGDSRELPVLSTDLVQAIHWSLGQDPVIITAEYMTSGESPETTHIDTAGDTR